MFENQTYEVILQRMLDRVSATMNKREGAIIYDALAPAAAELASAYIAFDSMMQETFGDTASREFLVRLCADRGFAPYAATQAICTVAFDGADVPIGNRFSGGNTSYVYIGNNQVQCEEAGVIGNEYIGPIVPIEYVQGLQRAEITEIAIYGEDEESTEDLRERYRESFEERAFGGNKKDYKNKTLSISGVGAVKITPVWNGAGTVKLTVLSSVFGKASESLVALAQKEFDPNQDGMGDGLAPIGHVVTVYAPTEVVININSNITYDSGYDWETCKTHIISAIEAYLLSLRKEWGNDIDGEYPVLVVRIAQIEAAILSVHGVVDVDGTTINSKAQNLTLSDFEIPVLGVINNA